ncbi:MAG: hypothetical protein JWP27_772 [Flaviaesturariibacter sp.]|nr:hypothetical protein [Flaviaesturariibacter sp.]
MLTVIIGYIASVLLALSLIVTNDLKFRWFNLFGCLAFIVYGILINAFPVLLTNSLLFLINLYYLARIYRTPEAFDLARTEPRSDVVTSFLEFYGDDVKTYFPQFTGRIPEGAVTFLVLRNLAIANLFAASVEPDGTATVILNYTVPKFRDYQVGTFIFQKEKRWLLSQGIRTLVYTGAVYPKHASFLRRMGFTAGESGTLVKGLD